MVLIIGNVDISPYIQQGGLKWTLSDLDNKYSGRTLDGVMHRTRVGQKVKLEVTCLPVKTYEASIILKAIDPVFVQAKYIDPYEGKIVEKTFYSNNKPATCMIQDENGEELWSGITFPLIEQ